MLFNMYLQDGNVHLSISFEHNPFVGCCMNTSKGEKYQLESFPK